MIDNLPSDWKVEYISDIFKLKQGNHLSMNDLEEDGYFVYGANGIIGKYHKYMYEESKVLITCRGATCGSINISKPKSWITGNAIALIEKKDYIDENYVAYFLRKDKLESVISGSAQPQITATNLSKLKIPIPPLQQQEKIVKILDLTSNLIEKQKELLEKYDLFLKSKFIEMFGDPISNPMGWENIELDKISHRITDGEHQTPKRSEKGIYLLSARNIKQGYIDIYNENVDYIEDNEADRIEKRLVIEEDDVLLSCSGTIGRVSINTLKERFCLVRSVAVIKLYTNKILPTFLMMYLQTKYMQLIMKKEANAVGQPNLFQKQIKKLNIYLPPIELQNQFSSIVQKIETIKEKENQKLKQMNDLHNSMMQKAFKGEIV